MEHNFFVYQRRALLPLLRWGIGSSLVGALLALLPGASWRQFGLQTAGWGIIDVLLAIAGRRDALLKAERSLHGEIDEQGERAAAERLRTILLVNAGLDLLYIAGGQWMVRHGADHPGHRGAGRAIIIQGIFLLLYDLLFARDIDARFLTK